jgi:predicted metal-dependent hydrolase
LQTVLPLFASSEPVPSLSHPVVWVDGEPVNIEVRVSPRARTLRVTVAPGQPVRLVVPERARRWEAERFLAGREPWIRDKVRWARSVERRPSVLGLSRSGVVWREGRAVPVTRAIGSTATARISGGGLVVTGRGVAAAQAVDRWYRRESRRVITASVERHAERLGLAAGAISIRDPRTRWGSCSASGALSFSWRLALAPPDVRDSVVVHELCHLKHRDHSPRFRRALEAAWPAWRDHDRWLREHGAELAAYDPAVALRTARGRAD